jgi:hypothetical protein
MVVNEQKSILMKRGSENTRKGNIGAGVRDAAYSPAYPPGPYRFVNREYLILTYRTDPAKLRAVVPEPLEFDEREALVGAHALLEGIQAELSNT